MTKPNEKLVEFPRQSARDILTDVLRDGAQQMLATAIEAEVDDYLAGRASTVDAAGRRYVVRNGHLPPRAIQTPLGDVQVQQPRVRDRRPTDERETFRSAILPPYLRKTPSLEALYPWLYLKGISTGDFGEALQALLGPEARGLSATTITRLKAVWEQEYQDWSKRSLAHRSYAYVWADGVYFNVRLEDTDNKRQCILVLMGAPRDGTKELIAITDGYRESEQSWRELLLDVRHRGLTIDPELAIGDGGLGFWGAVRKVFPQTREQRCWVHKTANVLNKLPTGVQPKAKRHALRHLDGGDAAGGRPGLRSLPGHVCREVPSRDHVSRQGPGRALDLLRLSGRALDPHPDHEPGRVDIRHRPAPHEEDERRGQPGGVLDDGIQAGDGRAEALESVERVSVDRRCHRRCALRRWCQKGSRLITGHTQHLAISPDALASSSDCMEVDLRDQTGRAAWPAAGTHPHPAYSRRALRSRDPFPSASEVVLLDHTRLRAQVLGQYLRKRINVPRAEVVDELES